MEEQYCRRGKGFVFLVPRATENRTWGRYKEEVITGHGLKNESEFPEQVRGLPQKLRSM